MSKREGGCCARRVLMRVLGRIGAICLVAALAVTAATGPAAARHRHVAGGHAAYAPVFSWIVLDAETGQVLGEQNADTATYPASLTKMMTLYLTFEALNQGKITLDQRFAVSEHAASRAPSKLGLEPGDSVSVHDLILGVVTKSANDAATVLAEGLAGSEENFARYMSWKAQQLGMDHTYYQNASGLPDPDQRTTARDIARLALALYHQFPREYRYFATREFDFRGEIVHSHNHLLDWYQGADGIKTGFINASGFNLAASAVRNGHRLIGVIMGGRTWRRRDEQMASLLDQGFAMLAAAPHATPAAPVAAPVVAAVA
ncbi:MAG TPA: D-alanyl-D-alanine carboxypeptidase family protein, partial [Stellaceae bacterium]|nr:D-alanyl-D-alanine carboxypeptidase family protein [Stellaceae bacterium]